ncbi:MAG: efflux RND transporter periplasmic adaptor subunit [Terrimicrobiaceae bacterium]|nr:efflux RND transporter periplasmic adaptor subunit [Terrimicrobiaceae bacterium]
MCLPYPKARALAIAAAVCFSLAACSQKPEEPAAAVPPVRIFELTPPSEASFRSFPGEVAAIANGRLSFDVGGRLIEFPVYDGKIVEPGELIGRLEPADFQAQFDSARTRFQTARDELARQQQLFDRRVISRAELDRHREAFEIADANFRTAQKALEDTVLNAPFKGRVAHRFVRNFQNVQARELIVLLQDVSRLKVDIQLPESSVTRAAAGATAQQLRSMIEARAEFAAMPGRFFELALDSFATRANPASRTFPVSFVFEPPDDSSILPGMTCNVFVRFKDETAANEAPSEFLVPVAAVATATGASSVWKWNPADGRVTRVSVELLGPANDNLRIRSADLARGDRIVASGVRFLSDGMVVREMETAGR